MPADPLSPESLSHIYSPPNAISGVAQPPETRRYWPAWLLLLSFGTFASTAALANFLHLMRAARWAVALGLVLSAVAALAGLVGAVRWFWKSERPRGGTAVVVNLLALLTNAIMFALGAFAAISTTFAFVRGRQVRRFGRIALPRVVAGHSWAHTKISVRTHSPIPTLVAAQWRENGRNEHASVAAFARLTLDLIALGAPPHLVSAAQADAIDEIRHAELCFSLARSLDGKMEDPGPFPAAQRGRRLPRTRVLGLAVLAVDSLVDGALHEGVSARVIAKLAKRSDVPAVRGVLKEIGADEGRHSAHGWDVVEWCLAEGGRPVAKALLGAIRMLPERPKTSSSNAAKDGSWESWGLHGEATELEEYAAARAALVARVEKLVERFARAA